MNLERYIQIYDDVLKPEAISSLIKWCNQQNFEEATVDKNIETYFGKDKTTVLEIYAFKANT